MAVAAAAAIRSCGRSEHIWPGSTNNWSTGLVLFIVGAQPNLGAEHCNGVNMSWHTEILLHLTHE